MRKLGRVALAALVTGTVAAAAGAAELQVAPSAAYLGFFGLRIEVGSDCAGPDLVVLSAPPATVTGDVEACREIEAAGVEVVGVTTFLAGEEIRLGEAFSVADGADFRVLYEPAIASPFASIANSAPTAEATYRASFHLLLDGLALAGGEEVEHFRGEADDGSAVFRLRIRPDPGSAGNLLALAALESAGWRESAPGEEIALPPGWNRIELDWAAGSDGHLLVSVNDAPFAGLTGLFNDVSRVDRVRWGAVDGVVAGLPGEMVVDGFTSWR